MLTELKTVLDILIDKNQTGFIKGTYKGENIRIVYDVMKYTEISVIPDLLVLINLEKAFDSIFWTSVNLALNV